MKPPITFQLFGQFLAQCCCLLVDFAFLFEFFFRIHILSGNPTTTVKCEAGYRSPANSIFFCCFCKFFFFFKFHFCFLATIDHAKNESKQIFAEIFLLKATVVHCRLESPLKKYNSLTYDIGKKYIAKSFEKIYSLCIFFYMKCEFIFFLDSLGWEAGSTIQHTTYNTLKRENVIFIFQQKQVPLHFL